MRSVVPTVSALLLACASARPLPPRVSAEELAIAGIERTVVHGEGGAIVDRVGLELDNRGSEARSLRVARVEQLHGSCEREGWESVRPLVVREPLGAVTLLPGEASLLAVLFDPVECASVCDRFGFRVHLEVDGRRRVVEVPLHVERHDP